VLLKRNWTWGPLRLFLKAQTLDFDTVKEPMTHMKVWAIFPGLPLAFWTREVVEVIGNKTGTFAGLEPNWATKKDRR
jgi:hypothetical protein